MPTILRRTTIVVRDIEASLAFYRDVVGLRVGWDRETTLGDAIPLTPGAVASADTLGVGATVFVIGTDECDAVHARMQAFGSRVYRPPYDQMLKGRDGRPIKMRSMAAWGPDGHFLEINQRT